MMNLESWKGIRCKKIFVRSIWWKNQIIKDVRSWLPKVIRLMEFRLRWRLYVYGEHHFFVFQFKVQLSCLIGFMSRWRFVICHLKSCKNDIRLTLNAYTSFVFFIDATFSLNGNVIINATYHKWIPFHHKDFEILLKSCWPLTFSFNIRIIFP